MDLAIDAQHLTREFTVRRRGAGRSVVRAVDDLTLRLEHGEAVGFVGANGAGKSTTIKMLTGILTPTRGEVAVLGRRPVPERRHLAREIGVVFGQRSQLWWDLPLQDSFEILGSMHRLSPGAKAARLERLVAGLDLAPFLDRPVRQLSLGQRMRGEVAAALLHSPRLVVLDEPTIGLDMISKEGLRRFLVEDRAERGTTLLLTTHDMADVERLCERIVVVSDGRTAYDGTLAGLRSSLRTPRELVLDLAEPRDALVLPGGVELLAVEAGGIRHRVRFLAEEHSAAALIAAISAQVDIADLSMAEPAIEDLVREIFARGA
ncbi:ABC transporter ATP-binding protein [Brachybacterium hainanense]|uniref:ATP-binding cassette domain-containing protein n=1 Tax=Brachybacterium hainanense TaxID=1541174 RepID=A0ABV6REX5_9MICO